MSTESGDGSGGRSLRPTNSGSSSSMYAEFFDGTAYESSSMAEGEVASLVERYQIPEGFNVRAPRSEERVNGCDRGVVALFEEFLIFGLRLPFHPLVTEILRRYELVPCQLAPNSIRAMISWVVLCHLAGVLPRFSLFRAFFLLVKLSGTKGSFGFSPRPGRKLFQFPGSSRGWRTRFFLVSSDGGWGFPSAWGEPDASPNGEKDVAPEDRQDFDALSRIRVPPVEELISEKRLEDAGLVPRRGEGLSDSSRRGSREHLGQPSSSKRKTASNLSGSEAKRASRKSFRRGVAAGSRRDSPVVIVGPSDDETEGGRRGGRTEDPKISLPTVAPAVAPAFVPPSAARADSFPRGTVGTPRFRAPARPSEGAPSAGAVPASGPTLSPDLGGKLFRSADAVEELFHRILPLDDRRRMSTQSVSASADDLVLRLVRGVYDALAVRSAAGDYAEGSNRLLARVEAAEKEAARLKEEKGLEKASAEAELAEAQERASAAEERARVAEGRQAHAERATATIREAWETVVDKSASLGCRLVELEARLEEAVVAEARAKKAEKEARLEAIKAVQVYKESGDFRAEAAKADAEMYALGFQHCKEMVSETFPRLDLERIFSQRTFSPRGGESEKAGDGDGGGLGAEKGKEVLAEGVPPGSTGASSETPAPSDRADSSYSKPLHESAGARSDAAVGKFEASP